jgi:pentapeptide MXKDX repeat protein
MTIRSRFSLPLAAATIGFALALAPAAFAQGMSKDAMGKTDTMSKPGDKMSKDAMGKTDTMSKPDDKMSKDAMGKKDMKSDGMKK